jgi:glycosyltransferase involved in cell wall biosynthesis
VKENFYLTASRIVPYKRIDLIVEAFNAMPSKRLVIVGDGPDLRKIRKMAGPNTTILGFQPAQVLISYMQRAQAFVFAAEEDFGIAPVEAQACGTPVIALAKGGALETVRGLGSDAPTGVLFSSQDAAGIIAGITEFEANRNRICAETCRENALRFSTDRFRCELEKFLKASWLEYSNTI